MHCLVCVGNTPYEGIDPVNGEFVNEETLVLCSSFCIALKLSFTKFQSQLYKCVFCDDCRRLLEGVPSIFSVPKSLNDDGGDNEIAVTLQQSLLDGYLTQLNTELDNNAREDNEEPDCPFQPTRLEILKELGLVVELEDELNPTSTTSSLPANNVAHATLSSSFNASLPLYIDLELDEEIPPDEPFIDLMEDGMKENEENYENLHTQAQILEVEGNAVEIQPKIATEIQKDESLTEINLQNEQNEEKQKGQENVALENGHRKKEKRVQKKYQPSFSTGNGYVQRAVSLIAAEKIKSVFTSPASYYGKSHNKVNKTSTKNKTNSDTDLVSSTSSTASSTLMRANKSKQKNTKENGIISGKEFKNKKSPDVEKSSIEGNKNSTEDEKRKISKSLEVKNTCAYHEDMPVLKPLICSFTNENLGSGSFEIPTKRNEDESLVQMPQLAVEIDDARHKKKGRKIMNPIGKNHKGFHIDSVKKNSKQRKLQKSNGRKGGKQTVISNPEIPIEYRSCSVLVENFSIKQIAEVASKNNVKISSILGKSSNTISSKSNSKSKAYRKSQAQVGNRTKTSPLSLSPVKLSLQLNKTSQESKRHGKTSAPVVKNIPAITKTVIETTPASLIIDNSSVVRNTIAVATTEKNMVEKDYNKTSTSVISPIIDSSIKNSSPISIPAINVSNFKIDSSRKSKRKPLKPIKGICSSTLLSPQQQGKHNTPLLSSLSEQMSQTNLEMQVKVQAQNQVNESKNADGMNGSPSSQDITTLTTSSITTVRTESEVKESPEKSNVIVRGPPYLPIKIPASALENATAAPELSAMLKKGAIHPSMIKLGPPIIRLSDATRAVSAVIDCRLNKNNNESSESDLSKQLPENGKVKFSSVSSLSQFKSLQNGHAVETQMPKIPKLTINISKNNSPNKKNGNSNIAGIYVIKGNETSGDYIIDGDQCENSFPNDINIAGEGDRSSYANIANGYDDDHRMSDISDSELGFLQEETNRFKFGLRPRRETIIKIKTSLESDSESDKSIQSKDSDNTRSDPMFASRNRKKKRRKTLDTSSTSSKTKSKKVDSFTSSSKKDDESSLQENGTTTAVHNEKDKPAMQQQILKKSQNRQKSSKLKSHKQPQHQKDPSHQLHCTICGKGFHYAAKLELHQKMHSDKKDFPCSQCPRSFISKQYLDIHTRNHPPPTTELNRFPCDKCEAYFSHLSTLREHQRSHTGKLPFQCDLCNERFPFASRLKRHQSVKHLDVKPYKCKHCGIAFKQAGNLRCHEYRHDENNKKFKCPFPSCSLRFFDKNKLKYHVTVHAGTKNHKCTHCSKSFRLSSSLKKHVSTVHVKHKPFVCSVPNCNKKFTQKQYLNYHQTTHPELNLPRYTCPEVGCGRSFAEPSSLREHSLKHSGGFKFACSQCDYKAAFKSRLDKHLLTHSTERKYTCKICRKSFTLRAYLKRHINTVHLKMVDNGVDDDDDDDEEGETSSYSEADEEHDEP